jgi:hypothetical protein
MGELVILHFFFAWESEFDTVTQNWSKKFQTIPVKKVQKMLR